MRTPHLFAATLCLGGLAAIVLSPESPHIGPRDALGESAPLNGDVQGVVQELKTKASQEPDAAPAQAMEEAAPQCLRLDAFRIEEEYRFLYRGSISPPERIFLTGFIAGAEKDRKKLELAADADLGALQDHLLERRAPSPYISTSQKAAHAAYFASNGGKNGWLYLIRTNKGLSVLKQAERSKIKYFYEEEREFVIPAQIPREEIVGAWPLGGHGAFNAIDNEEAAWPARHFYFLNPLAKFGSFIKNPHYSGPLKIVGDICPPNL